MKSADSDPILMVATGDGEGADLTDATLVLVARQSRTSTPVTLSVSPGPDITQGEFYWNRVADELSPGCWRVELQATRDDQTRTFPANLDDEDSDYFMFDVVASTGGAP